MLIKVKEILKGKDGVLEIISVGLLIVFVAIVMITPTKNLGTTLKNSFDKINTEIGNQLQNIAP